MKKLLVFGVIVLFLGLAIAPSINANIGELSVDIPQENSTLQLESEFQRIRAYIEMKSDEDCGCGDDSSTEWNYPGFCTILYILFWFFLTLVIMGISTEIPFLINDYANELNCYWAVPVP